MPRRICAVLLALALAICAAGQCAGELYAYYGDEGCVLIDAQGEIHSDAFDSILAVNSDTDERRFIARKLFDDVERATLLDAQGQPLLDRYYDAIYAQSGALITQRDGLLGALDWQGNEVLPTRYTILVPNGAGAYLTSTDDPGDGIADEMYLTLPDGSSRYLNLSANYISEFCEGLVRARSHNGKYGYLSQQGIWAIAPMYDEAGDFAGGKAVVWRGGLAGLIDSAGNAILPARYDSIIASSGGGAAELTVAICTGVATVYDDDMLPVYTESGVQYAYMPEPELAVLVREDGATLCNAQGRVLLEIGADEFMETLGSGRTLVTGTDGVYLAGTDGTVELEGAVEAYALRDGGRPYAVCVYDGEHWGACDLDGQEILPYEYDSVASMCEGVFTVRQGTRHGLINAQGEWIYSHDSADPLVG